jgi:hypothetical protein
MSKRARTTKDQLTGGSQDVNPQLLSGLVTQTAADVTTTAQITLPITRVPGGNSVTIIELLKFWGDLSAVAGTQAGEALHHVRAFLTTQNFGATPTTFNDPATLGAIEIIMRNAFTAAGSFASVFDGLHEIDFTDGAGHGILIGTDNLFIQLESATVGQFVATGVANTCAFKILYRFKRVNLVEYIGIVQSQQ